MVMTRSICSLTAANRSCGALYTTGISACKPVEPERHVDNTSAASSTAHADSVVDSDDPRPRSVSTHTTEPAATSREHLFERTHDG